MAGGGGSVQLHEFHQTSRGHKPAPFRICRPAQRLPARILHAAKQSERGRAQENRQSDIDRVVMSVVVRPSWFARLYANNTYQYIQSSRRGGAAVRAMRFPRLRHRNPVPAHPQIRNHESYAGFVLICLCAAAPAVSCKLRIGFQSRAAANGQSGSASHPSAVRNNLKPHERSIYVLTIWRPHNRPPPESGMCSRP